MTDNSTLPATGDVIAADEILGIKHQRVKVQFGADGSASDVSAVTPLLASTTSMGRGTLICSKFFFSSLIQYKMMPP